MTAELRGKPPVPRIALDRRHALMTLAYLAGIFWLSSRPDLGFREGRPLVMLLFNLAHVPLFAGLAYGVFKTLAAPRTWRGAALAFALSAACAALDEWHQSFVPGRYASLGDFLLDAAGIAAVLLAVRLREPGREDARR
jgi:VanZ family protein